MEVLVYLAICIKLAMWCLHIYSIASTIIWEKHNI
jgi:hypothetical protein